MGNENVRTSEVFPVEFSKKNRESKASFSGQDPSDHSQIRSLKRNASIKHVCQFPITLCRRSSKDFITWVNGFTITKASPLEVVDNYFKQIQPVLLYLFLSFVVFVLGLEVCLCVVLLIDNFFDMGFLFLLTTFVIVCSINMNIMSNKLRNEKKKKKSKEI